MLFIKKSKSLLQKYSIHHITSKLKKGTLHITGASCLGNTMIGTAKMIIGILSMSFFTCASALYTYTIVITKIYILYGISQTKNNTADQYNYYQRSGKLLVVAGTIYMIYSIILLFHPVNTQYNKYMAIAIACFTFSELALNIRGIIVERNHKMPLFHALQIVNLASSCICLVLTQTAILAFTSIERGVQHNISSNGFIGILMGTLSTILGIYLVIHSDHFMYGKDIKKYIS